MFRQAIFFINRNCPVNCYSCNVACNDKNREFLSPEWFEKFIKNYKNLNFQKYIILTGGEPFLNIDSLQRAISLFSKENFNIEVLTSGIWFKTNPEYLNKLVGNGNFSMRISLDYEHEKMISLETISDLIEYSLNLGLNPNFTIREIPGFSNDIGYYKNFLEKNHKKLFDQNIENSRWLHVIPHINIPDKKFKVSNKKKIRKRCFLGFKDIIVGADSMLYPCCGLFSLKNHKKFSIGNPLKLSYEDIMEIFEKREIFKILKDEGPHKLSNQNIENYSTICELCLKILKKI